jgi:two-component system phosphate regulon sensor histidine kinase PhoR
LLIGQRISGARRLVWIVDDSAMEAEQAGRALGPEFRTRVFTDGGTMLEALATGEAPDALLLDWQMPGLSGIEVTEFLRGNPSTAELPIVLLTGFRATGDVVRGLSAGANDYVVKPFAAEELSARVTALVRTRELRERAERAEAVVGDLLEQLPEALIATDEAGVIRFVNTVANELLGDGDRLVGRPVGEVLPSLSLSALAPTAREESRDLRLGDEIFAPAVRRMNLKNLGAGFTITLRNVTAKRRDEDRRLDFYSIIAHDLRSPLAAIAMRTELIRTGARGPISAEAVADLDRVRARINELVALINDFLDLARIEGAGLKMEAAPFDLSALVADVLDDFRPTAESAALALRFAPAGDAAVHGDRRRMTQVVSNLVANAIKFTPPGGHIDVAVEPSGDAVEVRVCDDGRGIAAESLPKLFQRYSRGAQTGDYAGTGLGLLIVREIVEAHGGTVGATSELGRGSTFWVRLPRRGRVGVAA